MSKTGRNDPCPCGSGKKYKKCCEEKIKHKIARKKIVWNYNNKRRKIKKRFETKKNIVVRLYIKQFIY